MGDRKKKEKKAVSYSQPLPLCRRAKKHVNLYTVGDQIPTGDRGRGLSWNREVLVAQSYRSDVGDPGVREKNMVAMNSLFHQLGT